MGPSVSLTTLDRIICFFLLLNRTTAMETQRKLPLCQMNQLGPRQDIT